MELDSKSQEILSAIKAAILRCELPIGHWFNAEYDGSCWRLQDKCNEC